MPEHPLSRVLFCKPLAKPTAMNIHLGMPLPTPSSKHTRNQRRAAVLPLSKQRSCWLLHQMGFALPSLSPETRCALTAPFHPDRFWLPKTGGLFSVALSSDSRRLAVNQHLTLWCPDFPPAIRPCNNRRSSRMLQRNEVYQVSARRIGFPTLSVFTSTFRLPKLNFN
jgi:hypothetical protein